MQKLISSFVFRRICMTKISQDFIDYVEYKKTVSKSKATQEDVEQLMEEINDSSRERSKEMAERKASI